MARKYAQTRHDREDESRGMRRYEREHHHDEMDTSFSGMIHEDHSAVANLPQEVIQKTYPKTRFVDRYEIDDTIEGLDDTRDDTVRRIDKDMPDSRW